MFFRVVQSCEFLILEWSMSSRLKLIFEWVIHKPLGKYQHNWLCPQKSHDVAFLGHHDETRFSIFPEANLGSLCNLAMMRG